MSEGNDASAPSLLLGQNVRTALNLRGMTGADLARGLGVNQSTVARLIQGQRTMTVPMLVGIARQTGYDPCVILRGDFDATPCGGH